MGAFWKGCVMMARAIERRLSSMARAFWFWVAIKYPFWMAAGRMVLFEIFVLFLKLLIVFVIGGLIIAGLAYSLSWESK